MRPVPECLPSTNAWLLPSGCGSDRLVGRRILEHAVDVDTGFVAKHVEADHGLGGTMKMPDTWATARTTREAVLSMVCPAPYEIIQRADHLLEHSITSALA